MKMNFEEDKPFSRNRKGEAQYGCFAFLFGLLSNEHLLHDDETALVCHGDGEGFGVGDL